VHSANEGIGTKAHVRNWSHKDGPKRRGATSGREAGGVSGHLPSDLPVVIFEVDAAGIDRRAAPARRWDVRLVGSTGGDPRAARSESRNREVSAVLLLRAMTPSRLLSCVRALSNGGVSISPELLCEILLEPANSVADVAESRLTARECDVLRLLADGETTHEIAQHLSYSDRTVKKIVHDVLLKLNCRTRAHAVAVAARQGAI
jgi:DNA-binding NarL/FixJ family response regulator